MRNSSNSISRTSTSTTDLVGTRAQIAGRRRIHNRFLAGGAVIALGAIVGSGFVLHATAAARDESVSATSALSTSTGLHAEQLPVYGSVLKERAVRSAEGTISNATVVLAAAQGKTDTAPLSASVASLTNFTRLAPESVFALVDKTNSESANVQAAATEADRAAAAQAAAAAAAQAAAANAAAANAAAAKAAAAKAVVAKPTAARVAVPAAATNATGAQAIARDQMAAKYGWGADQLGCLVPLWTRESGWNVNAFNASSGATGIPQALPGSKMASAGADWRTNPATQISWGLSYIAGRYGTPCAAWGHSQATGWY